MQTSVLKSILAAAAVLVAPLTSQAAQWGHNGAIDVEVISGYGHVLPEYPVKRKGRTYRAYLEAERGDEYAIRVSNRTSERVGVVVAVDGRNIISGKHSKLRSSERMYILGPHESSVYRGWRTGQNRVNSFYFTDAGDSYSAAWGDYSAMGVIAVAAFAERVYYDDYRHDHKYKSERKSQRQSAPQAKGKSHSKRHGAESDSAGTGFGNESWSPSRRVYFEPERKPFNKVFLKYAWRETLCEQGVIDCYRRDHKPRRHNRFWDERYSDNFAPYPPRRW